MGSRRPYRRGRLNVVRKPIAAKAIVVGSGIALLAEEAGGVVSPDGSEAVKNDGSPSEAALADEDPVAGESVSMLNAVSNGPVKEKLLCETTVAVSITSSSPSSASGTSIKARLPGCPTSALISILSSAMIRSTVAISLIVAKGTKPWASRKLLSPMLIKKLLVPLLGFPAESARETVPLVFD